MSNAKKLASGSWRALVYAGKDASGKRLYKSFTDSSKKKVEYEAAQFALKHKKSNREENLTFQQASDRYIESKKNLLSPATIRGYRVMQNNAFPLLLDLPIGKLVLDDTLQRQMNDNAAKYSAKSLKNQWGFITAVFGYFRFRVDQVTLKPKEKVETPVPKKADINKIIALLHNAPDIECQALLALTCSLRQSEIAALKPSDIAGRVLHIHSALVPNEQNHLVYKPTNKSSAGTRTVCMPEYLARRMAETCKGKSKDEYVFSIPPMGVLARFHKLLKSNGMYPYTMHALRHGFAAIMHAQGVPDKYVMEMGGWSSDYVMKQIYQYTFDEETQKAQKKANRFFDGIMQHEMQHK